MSLNVRGLSDERLGISHMSEIKSLIVNFNPMFSEYCFANLYLFRLIHDYRILRKSGFIFLQGKTYDDKWFIMPFSSVRNITEPVLYEIMQDGFLLYPVMEEDLYIFNSEKYTFSYNIDDSDYIYTLDKIRNYPGRNLHSKRNLVKQYRKLYSYRDMPYDCSFSSDAIVVLDNWFKNTNLPLEATDYVSCREFIEKCDVFGLSGQILYVEDNPTGILFGEKLNSNTYVIHFAKGDVNYKGIYPHMYNTMANYLDSNEYSFLNFEQDLGKENLRKAKSTYIADSMIHKYRVSLV